MNYGSTNLFFTYNDEGIRTSKTVDGVTTTYTTIDGRITSQNDGTNELYFRYDKNNSLTGFNLSGEEYLYVKNAQGDITGILDKDGRQVVSYTYDAWGKVESISGSSADTVGKINPMRYRGYYQDTETGWYYLQSRYYNPEMCRFINADEPSMLEVSSCISISSNMYSYGNNNPLMNEDPFGRFALRTSIISGIIDLVLLLVPGVNSINRLLKQFKRGKWTATEMGGFKKTFTVVTEKVVSRIGLKITIAKRIVGLVNSALLILTGLSIGSLVVWGLKRIFRTEIRYERMFGWFGPKKNYEYMIF